MNEMVKVELSVSHETALALKDRRRRLAVEQLIERAVHPAEKRAPAWTGA